MKHIPTIEAEFASRCVDVSTEMPVPFRNGFSSFFTALQFGLTLGGGGEDSTSCPFSIELDDVDSIYPTNGYSSICHVVHRVSGMDVFFAIHELYFTDGEENSPTIYYVGSSYPIGG